MKDSYPSTPHELIPLVVLLPNEDHRIYSEARRVLRCLMGRKTPTIEVLVVQDLRGRDADGIVDNYLDAICWPLERGRAVTIRLREQAKRDNNPGRRTKRLALRLSKPPADPARN